jgi:two-component system, OmpR family, response regulator VicR
MKPKIFFVEDDLSLAMVTKDSLELYEYEVCHYENGEIAWGKFQKEHFDICVLDVMLPKIDGFDLAQRIRNKNADIPIIFLTAKSLQEDKILGLKLGADDYMTKPFDVEELVLKLEVFLRRTRPAQPEVKNPIIYHLGKYTFDFDNLTLQFEQETPKSLTLREAEVLQLFCENKGVILKRDEILKKIWGKDDYFMGRSLDVFITRIRKYLKDDTTLKVENIPSVGFRLIN